MPVPMIDPIPSAVRCQGPSERRSWPPSASACRSANDFFENRPMRASVPHGGAARLAHEQRDGTGLAWLEREAVFGRRLAGVALEQTREMALIAEAGGDGDVAQRRARDGKLAPCKLDADLTDVARERHPVDAPERTREVHRMHAHVARDLDQ